MSLKTKKEGKEKKQKHGIVGNKAKANLETGVSRKQSVFQKTLSFPKNEKFLPPDTHIS